MEQQTAPQQLHRIGRRDLITMLGGAAIAGPRTARAQRRPGTISLVGVLIGPAASADDGAAPMILTALRAALQEAGWIEGRTVHVERRFGRADPAQIAAAAAELVALAPDVIYAVSGGAAGAVHREKTTIPVVFLFVSDPVELGWVKSFAHPGGTMTGFVVTDATVGGKYVQLLREIAPRTTAVGLLFNPKFMPELRLLIAAAKRAAGSAVSIVTCEVESDEDIDRCLSALARNGHGAVAAIPDAFASAHYTHIVAGAARLRLPAIYGAPTVPARAVVESGGLMSYFADTEEQCRQAGVYVARILKGERPGDLPVQAPTKYTLAINLKTASALGLTIPPTLFALADEVLE